MPARSADVSADRDPLRGAKNRSSGFTIMEIMLAILILGLVVTTVLASFNAVFSTTDALQSSSTIYEMAKNCLKRMSLDLESAYVVLPPLYRPPEFDEPPNDYRMVGSLKDIGGTSFAQLRFTSRAHLAFENNTSGGVAEIIYYVHEKEDGNRVLKRADHLYPYPAFEETGSDPSLCEHVKSLAFTYVDEEGSETDRWDSESDAFDYATPTAVVIRLEVDDGSGAHVFETMVKFPMLRLKKE